MLTLFSEATHTLYILHIYVITYIPRAPSRFYIILFHFDDVHLISAIVVKYYINVSLLFPAVYINIVTAGKLLPK